MNTTETPPPGSLQRMVRLLAELQSSEGTMKIVRMATHATVGRIMREMRQASGLSLRETARRLKCSAPFLSDMELGRRGQSIEWARKLAKVTKQPNDPSSATRPTGGAS